MSGMSQRRLHIINASGSLLIPATALIVAPILARSLGPLDRGLFSNDQALMLIASSLFGLGISDSSAVKWAQWSPRSRSRLCVFNALSGCVIAILLASLLFIVRDPSPWELALVCVGGLALAVAVHARGIALNGKQLAAVGFEKWITSLGRLVLTVLLAAFGLLSVETGLATIILPQCVGAVFLAFKTSGKVGDESRERINRRSLAWMIGGGVAGVLLVHADQAVLVAFIGPTELGYYSIAVTIAEVYTAAARPFRDSALMADSTSGLKRTIVVCILSLSGLSLAAAGVMWFAVPLIFGHDYSPAVVACYVMVIGGVAKGTGFLLNGVLSRTGHVLYRFGITWLAVVVNLGAIPVFAQFGATGAAIAATLGYMTLMIGGLPMAFRGAKQSLPS
ncbi:oligosaccharide flippase family protein [Cellulosimicrobium funkei]|nr:oligosaccharide flippase family protein [Cellulosimicrobium funkei]